MSSPRRNFDHLRSHRQLLIGAVIFAVLSCGAVWACRSNPFWYDVTLSVLGAAVGLVVAILGYDLVQKRRNERLWRPLRRIVDRAIARSLFMHAQNLSWRLFQDYTSYGTYVTRCDLEPDGKALAEFRAITARMRAHLGQWEGNWQYAHVFPELQITQRANDLAQIYRQWFEEKTLGELRPVTGSLYPVAEDVVELVLAAEDLLAEAWLTHQSAMASGALEMRDYEFLAGFQAVLTKFDELYAQASRDYQAAGVP